MYKGRRLSFIELLVSIFPRVKSGQTTTNFIDSFTDVVVLPASEAHVFSVREISHITEPPN
jgi:hypothetical protein